MSSKYEAYIKKNFKIFWAFLQFIWNYCWNTPYLRFLNIGVLNLIFLLCIGLLFEHLLKDFLPTILIAICISLFHISFSFAMRKVFIYKTKGNWLREYLRCYAYYWLSIVVYTIALWLFVDILKFYFWLSQILSLIASNVFYSLGTYFTLTPVLPEDEIIKLSQKDFLRKH